MKWSRYLHCVPGRVNVAMFNALTGAFARLSITDGATLGDMRPGQPFVASDCPPSLYASLVHGGFIVQSWDDEFRRLHLEHVAARSSAEYVGLTIVPTMNCNLRCTYCFEESASLSMDQVTQESLVKYVRGMITPSAREVRVTWYGGEPLLHMSALRFISRGIMGICAERGLSHYSSIITNGTLLTPETAIELKELGIERYQVTVDGTRETHDKRKPTRLKNFPGSFQTIIENLKALALVEGILLNVRMNVDRDNKDEIKPLLQYLVADGVINGKTRSFYIAPVQNWSQGACLDYPEKCFIPEPEFAQMELDVNEEVFVTYGFDIVRLPMPTSTPCGSLSPFSQVIGPQGELYRCWTDVGRAEWITGHVLLPGLQTPRGFQYRSRFPLDTAECRECGVLPLCLGGCPAKPFHGMQSFEGHFCSRERYRLESLVKQQLEHLLAGGSAGGL